MNGLLGRGERGSHGAENNGGGERGGDELLHFRFPSVCAGFRLRCASDTPDKNIQQLHDDMPPTGTILVW